MRQKRAKAYRKLMQLYCMSFGFREPYQTLVDSEMCKLAVSQKFELVKQLGIVLQAEVKPMITQCCIHELYLQGREQQAAVDLAKTFERRRCNHREAIAGDECLTSVIGDKNKHRYVVASQSQPLRAHLRSIPAVPLVHMNRAVMVLEPPSDITLRAKMLNEEQKLHATGSDIALAGPSQQAESPMKKKKGPKAPNPLSVKKKTVEPIQTQKAQNQYHEPQAGSKRKVDCLQGANTSTAQDGETTSPKRKRKRRRKVTGDDSNPTTIL
ncbi:Fcf1-domain-containing protein [Panaeolus papilionaceus]|nr:Fcf1-domain-containing protein [Panaeolus papilionaceus]